MGAKGSKPAETDSQAAEGGADGKTGGKSWSEAVAAITSSALTTATGGPAASTQAKLTSHQQREADLVTDWSHPPPWPLWNVMNAVKSLPPPPPIRLMNTIQGFIVSQLVYTAVRLEIADKLVEKALDKDELAAAVGAVPERVQRLMLALIAVGVFACDSHDPSRYVNNAMSATLRRDHPNSMAAFVDSWIGDSWTAWGHAYEAIKDGGNVYTSKDVYQGKGFYDFLAENPERGKMFDQGMTSIDALGAWAEVHDGPFKELKHIWDIGAGNGHFLAKLLRTYPHLTGAIFELPHVIDNSTKAAWTPGTGEYKDVSARVDIIPGSYFDEAALPKAREGDAYLLRHTLANWDDESARVILSNVRKAIGTAKKTRVLIADMVVPDRKAGVDPMTFKHILGLHMSVVLGSKERTPDEWESVIESSGFVVKHVYSTRSITHIIEAVPKEEGGAA